MKFVVTGTGRSGTRWASEVLGVGHQAMFTGEGFVENGLQGDCSFWAASQDLEGWRVVLLVRDPRYVVGSWLASGEFYQTLQSGYWRMWQHCHRLDPAIFQIPETDRRIAHYWWTVNYRLAQTADVVMRLEDATPEALADACGEVPYRDMPPPGSSTEPVALPGQDWLDNGLLMEDFGYDC